jgi:hypothetical protein
MACWAKKWLKYLLTFVEYNRSCKKTTHNIGTETKYKVDVHTDVQNIYHSTNTHSHMHTVLTKVVVNNNNINKGRFASPYLLQTLEYRINCEIYTPYVCTTGIDAIYIESSQ